MDVMLFSSLLRTFYLCALQGLGSSSSSSSYVGWVGRGGEGEIFQDGGCQRTRKFLTQECSCSLPPPSLPLFFEKKFHVRLWNVLTHTHKKKCHLDKAPQLSVPTKTPFPTTHPNLPAQGGNNKTWLKLGPVIEHSFSPRELAGLNKRKKRKNKQVNGQMNIRMPTKTWPICKMC